VIRGELLEVWHQDLGPIEVLCDREERAHQTVALRVHRERELPAELGIFNEEHRVEIRGEAIAVRGYGVETLSNETSVQEGSPPRTRVTVSATLGHYLLPAQSAAESPDCPQPALPIRMKGVGGGVGRRTPVGPSSGGNRRSSGGE